MGESLVSLVPIIAIFAIFYLLMIRPASKRQKAMREMQSNLQVGERVLTQSGFLATITGFQEDLVVLEIAPGVEVTVIRAAIGGLAKDAVPAGTTEIEPEVDAADRDGDR